MPDPRAEFGVRRIAMGVLRWVVALTGFLVFCLAPDPLWGLPFGAAWLVLIFEAAWYQEDVRRGLK